MKRRYHGGTDFRVASSIDELRHIARRHLPHFVAEYIDSGSGDETTLARNRNAFEQWQFVPRTLVDTGAAEQGISLFGAPLPSPLIVAPTGFNGLTRIHGDLALARAAAQAGVPFTLSTFANDTLEAVAAAAPGRNWMQIYILEDAAITRSLVERALAADYEALVVTTDANAASGREWLTRCYRAPGKLNARNLLDCALHPRWASALLRHGEPRFANLTDFLPAGQQGATSAAPFVTGQLKPRITWADIERLRAMWPRRLIVKGVMAAADAARAQAAGADAVVLTNHGGRQLDGAMAPLEVLGEVRAAVPGLPLIIDSGFRRGIDVVKAMALGAAAVMVGRVPLYGLAAGGEAGVAHALKLLRGEIGATLSLLGCNSLEEAAHCVRRTHGDRSP